MKKLLSLICSFKKEIDCKYCVFLGIKIKIKKSYSKLVKSLWSRQGFNENLEELLNFLMNRKPFYIKLHSDVYLIYVLHLLKKNCKEDAILELRKYYKKYKDKNIYKFIPVANLASEIGITSNDIQKATFIFSHMEKNTKNKILQSYLKDKQIAVVGNSGIELHQNKGAEIDNHDVVIRFNNFPSEGYESDYGTKTSVWMRTLVRELKPKDVSKIDHVVLKTDIWNLEFPLIHLDDFYENISKYPSKYSYVENIILNELIQKANVWLPTTGAIAIWLVYSLNKNFNNTDIYAFSFLNMQYSGAYHFYDNITPFYHDTDSENKFLKSIYVKDIV